ncbi:putative glucosylceramidase 4 [Cylas formicarius]|uniref:putative glucosylceramidase 4 n=1 Tax=Cylas formicarius TaxID=197179 RepID=UPI002958C2E0|nr:putative glucosylceramidase 4 [Cylas formicarius]
MIAFGVLSYVLFLLYPIVAQKPCIQRELTDGTVCVCNSTYCDSIPELLDQQSGQYQLYFTSKEHLGFQSNNESFSKSGFTSSYAITIPSVTAVGRKIEGFGCSFTDAVGENIVSLPKAIQDNLLNSYFSADGINYSFGRVPIGGTDFSTRRYSNCDTPDETLDSFALQPEDLNYKIAAVKLAEQAKGSSLKLYASPWSPPTWMKTSNEVLGNGSLKEEYYDLWSQMFVKFFQAYREQGVEFWGVSTQNEPFTRVPYIPNCAWDFDSMNKFVSENLGPAIRNSDFKDLKIILLEDNRSWGWEFVPATLSNPEVMKYADAIGIHWYSDNPSTAYLLDTFNSDLKDLFVFGSEASISLDPIGSWENGVSYINDIIEDLSHDLIAWVDWNCAVDTNGGPGGSLAAPIIVDVSAGEFYKQPMFYALGHFSKFVIPGSSRLDINTTQEFADKGLSAIAFLRPDNRIAMIIHNESNEKLSIQVNILEESQVIDLEALSFNTLLYTI